MSYLNSIFIVIMHNTTDYPLTKETWTIYRLFSEQPSVQQSPDSGLYGMHKVCQLDLILLVNIGNCFFFTNLNSSPFHSYIS
jgi:hypothetical protein